MLRSAVLTFICLSLPLWCAAQTALRGSVTDAVTGSVLQHVSVYIPELHQGTATDSTGNFGVDIPHTGVFMIQFTCTGYESQFRDVRMTDGTLAMNVALRPSTMELQEVNIVGTQLNAPRGTSRTVEVITAREMRATGALSLSDAVAKLPGVSQLTTGVGISKPVIRGLYGNRVQVNTLGLRFDNQQWQDEHGLGLSADGVERVEVIKGPAALQYGSEAIGGVLNVVEERPAPIDSLQQDARLQFFSNTRGVSAGYGIRASNAERWWRVRAGADSHADYSSAGDTRVINSRFASYDAKASMGWQHKRWVSTNNLFLSLGQFGFVFDSLARDVVDARASRSFAGPHHTVMIGLFSTENTFYGDQVKWKVNAGWTSNKRQEQEGGSKVSLDMLLNTASLLTQATAKLGEAGSWTNGASFLYQTNTNMGARVIVPDAVTLEGSLFSYVQERIKQVTIEGGLRLDLRSIDAFRTLTLDMPFNKQWSAVNGSVGLAWDPIEELNIKANVSSGYRSGNLAELGSNGLHEGTRRWEIGDPDLQVESNLGIDLGCTYEWKEQVELRASIYRNTFNDYIFLTPTNGDTLGLQIYRYVQVDATLQGGEVSADIHPRAVRWLDVSVSYAHLEADQSNGDPLPFIPADRLGADIRLTHGAHAWLKIGVSHVLDQDHPAQFEMATPAYTLLNASLGTEWSWGRDPLEVAVVCNNLLDEQYFDHLSRYKAFDLYDVGRNISLSLKLNF